MLRVIPHGEDYGGIAGGDTDRMIRPLGRPIAYTARGQPPGNDGVAQAQLDQAQFEAMGIEGDNDYEPETPQIDFLRLVREAEDQAMMYVQQVNRKAWGQTLRAFHNEHYVGSKYMRSDYHGRSKHFVPMTRTAVRKDLAAVSASLFNNVDAINCLAGDESDMVQRASAAVMEQLVNYRIGGRPSGPGSVPWFLVALGARQDSVLTGICASKQYWLQKFRKTKSERIAVSDDDTGAQTHRVRDHYALEIDRPDIVNIPPENIILHSAADWRNPAQSAAFLIVKWPMQIEEIKEKQDCPVNPWKKVPEEILRTSLDSGRWDAEAVRRNRESGLDRFDEVQSGTHFQVCWVYEVFIRVGGDDWHFYCINSRAFLTDPKPTREVYPEQYGERPITIGYGSIESHRIYPMSPAESWQPLQMEINDIRNLQLDATKQNVMPITKIRRGRQIDLNQVMRRSSGSAIMVNEADDVTFEQPPQMATSSVELMRELGLQFDDAAGQQNYGTVEASNAVGKTLGGLKLAAGAANAVQEFDIRIWLETWTAPTLQQIVRLEQYYESDPVVLGIAGQKAQIFKKFGLNRIDDDLMSQDINVRVSVGLGAGDPMQRLQKFQAAASVVEPILGQSPEFQSGQMRISAKAIIEEVFGAVGYKDGGARFFEDTGQPKQNPMQDLQLRELLSKITKNERTGQGSLLTGIANVGKVGLGKRELEARIVDMLMGHQRDSMGMGFDHGHRSNDQHLAAMDHGHRHGMAIREHLRGLANDQADAEAQAAGDAGTGGAGSSPSAAPSKATPPGSPSASPAPGADAVTKLLASGIEFTRDQRTGRINGIKPMGQKQGALPYPMPAR